MKYKKFEILLSCMYEKDMNILERSNIKCDCVIVNQCNKNSKERYIFSDNKKCIWINSNERGLSKSRNMAIENAMADICLIADNDQIFDEDLEEKILTAYRELPKADIIIFDLYNKKRKIKNAKYKMGRLELLRAYSLQISFKRKVIINSAIKFDINLGAGTGNGAGEENKFLLDAYDKGLKIYHYPLNIARMVENESTWFSGYNEEYFYKRGISTRYILGFWLSSLYAIYYAIFKYKLYREKISLYKALKNMFKGIRDNKLSGI